MSSIDRVLNPWAYDAAGNAKPAATPARAGSAASGAPAPAAHGFAVDAKMLYDASDSAQSIGITAAQSLLWLCGNEKGPTPNEATPIEGMGGWESAAFMNGFARDNLYSRGWAISNRTFAVADKLYQTALNYGYTDQQVGSSIPTTHID